MLASPFPGRRPAAGGHYPARPGGPAAPAKPAAKVETFLVPIRLTVAADGSGEYRTVQEAVMAVRDFMQVPAVIFIKNGTYREKLLIPSQKTNLTLLGESAEGVVIAYADYSGDTAQHSTYTSSTVRVQGTYFTAENITFENVAGRVGQVVALHVEGDRATFLSTAKPILTSRPPRPGPGSSSGWYF